jgi:hypothetical protein
VADEPFGVFVWPAPLVEVVFGAGGWGLDQTGR